MATPAASAWHRRRNLLSTPANSVNPNPNLTVSALRQKPQIGPLTSVPHPNTFSQSRRRAPLYPARARDGLTSPSRPGSNSISLLQDFRHFKDPLRFRAETSWLKAVAVSIFSLSVAFFFAYIVSCLLAAAPSLSRAHLYRPAQHHYPKLLFILKMFAFGAHVLVLFTMYFLFFRIIAKQVRRWPGHPSTRSASERAFLRLRLLHAAGCVVGCAFQSLMTAYIAYGPSVFPLPPDSLGSDLSLRNLTHRFTPKSLDLSLSCLFSCFAGFLFSVCWMWSESTTMHAYPFQVSSSRRWAVHAPKILLLSGIPVVCSVAPAFALHWVLYPNTGVSLSEEGLWSFSYRLVCNVIGISSSVFVALLSWNLLDALDIHYVQGLLTLSRTGTDDYVFNDEIALNRDRILQVSRNNSAEKRFDCMTPDLVQETLDSLTLLCQTDESLEHFPGFLDATGDAWRFSLEICLSPLDVLQEILGNCNAMQLQSSVYESRKGLFLRPSRSEVPSFLLSWLGRQGARRQVLFQDYDACIKSCEIISKLVTASYKRDSYGVVHRTLPQLVGGLLMCKQQTETFLLHQDPSGKLRIEDSVLARMGGLDMGYVCKNLMLFRSEYETIAAIDDALTLAIYQIVGSFRSHMYSYLDGMEVAWDRSLDKQLASFLDYQAS